MMNFHSWILFMIISTSAVLLLTVSLPLEATKDANKYTALYIFGDSILDPGNNIYFPDSLAKANYLPYGIDFSRGPTGRFCNGKILVDFVAEHLGFPLIPSYADIAAKGADFLSGVNFASAGAGLLNETGDTFGRIIPLPGQISNLKETVAQLRNRMQEEELADYLARALVFLDIGSNDYLNNYMKPLFYRSSHIYTPQQFADLLIKLYKQHVLEIQSLGLRKFVLTTTSPIGCAPIRARNGTCDSHSNEMLHHYNSKLKSLVNRFRSDYPQSAFMFFDSLKAFFRLRDNAEAYGFKSTDKSCCGFNNYGGTKPLCFKNSSPCPNRNEYIFWDSAHPTEAANRILAQYLFDTTTWQ